MELQALKGIGEKTAQLLNHLGIFRAEELTEFYPRSYLIYEEPLSVKEAVEKEGTVGVYLGISRKPGINRVRNLQILTIEAKDQQGDTLVLTWFNMPFLKNVLRQGERYVFYGKISVRGGQFVMEQPRYYTPAQYKALLHTMQPVYPLTKGLSNKIVSKAVQQALQAVPPKEDFLPEEIVQRQQLMDFSKARYTLHFPKDWEAYQEARKRLVFQEFFLFILSMGRFKIATEGLKNHFPIRESVITRDFIALLPFALTKGQQTAYEEICRDMDGPGMMNRLIQGDVGSGKTIVAVLALMNTVYEGYQGAMMVPTEVLARQQKEAIEAMFARAGIHIEVCLLIGSMTAREKRAVYEKMETGEAQMIIGTHALIQEKAVYRKLGLIVTDEQHRFGVNQREAFFNKGERPHVLVMSATPIPRTLAIILYGDLDISLIKELPAKRLPIKNCVVDHSYREKAYAFITNEVRQGHQAYVICPMVEERETTEAENVVDYARQLQERLGREIRVEYLHGKMSGEEKQRIMEAFGSNAIQVLVSTTVIEVGVNVPNATVMLIEDANRFGLAQLHQLRGRVGRGSAQSYCIFMAPNLNEKIRERLDILNHSNDGFKIAEEDLKLRGPGEMFGVRQSGEFSFRFGDIYGDAQLLKAAAAEAKEILNKDRRLELPRHALLAREIAQMTAQMKLV